MAGKSVKRVRIDVSSSKETTPHVTPMTGGDGDHREKTGSDEDVVSRLRTELETATKCIEQLRREKDYETRQVREEESNRSSTAMKELESRLRADGRREVERTRETVKSRLEADTARLVGRYERTIKRLSSDLDRCRNELREEIEKRGMSSTTRGGFEAERSRLLTEVRDLKAAKRRLEETIESNAEVDKQRTVELKRTQDACKAEVAKVSKEANAEIRKLLEELKAKDHQLALLDRNQYADRGASLPKHQTVENLCDNNSNDVSLTEKISNLEKDLAKLRDQLATKEVEKVSMKSRIDELQRELDQKNEAITNLRKTQNNQQQSTQNSILVKNQPKAVRFLLPGSTSPVPARDVEFIPESDDENDNESVCSEMSCSSSGSASSSPEATAFYSENMENNYHLLLTEHLNLQRSLAQLLLSSSKNTTSETLNNDEKQIITCQLQECITEKDSMKVALEDLKEQNDQFEENVYQLQQQVNELNEQNENLEFQVFELEDSVEKCKLTHKVGAAEDLLEKTRGLENEMSTLKDRVAFYRTIEAEITMLAGFDLRQSVAFVKSQLEGIKNHPMVGIPTATRQEQVGELRVPALTGDVEDLSVSAMNCSMSTTSGFDEDDNSCASSVADLRFEEMPSEETWGFDEEECSADGPESSAPTSAAVENDKNVPQESRQQCLQVDSEEAKTTNDEIWMARVEKVEARLAVAIQSEERARDQMALLAEEKDRRISALQEQVDVLEANEFRLSETIRSLERLEQTFNLQMQVSAKSSCSASPILSTSSEPDDLTAVHEGNWFNLNEVFGELVMHETLSDNHMRYQTGAVLNASLNKLRQAKAESDIVEKRIRELSESGSEDDASDTVVPASKFEINTNVIVDFESEYLELETLFKELKNVLSPENGNVKEEPFQKDVEGGILEPDCTVVNDAGWTAEHMSFSMPTTPVFEIPTSSASSMLERSREFELTERHLTQQIKALEHERDTLRDALCDGDAVMREFGIQLVELQASEQTLKEEVSRLKAKEDWLISRNEELMELVGRFEESLKNNRGTETDLRSRCERLCARETELTRELEDVRDEQRSVETRYRRWIAQLDDEKVRLQCVVDQLSDKNGDLEGREAGLLCRIRKLEAAEFGLRGEVAELERSLNDALDDRERILAQVTDKNEDHVRSPVTLSIDCWTQSEDVVHDSEEHYRRVEERAEFFKEMLEFTEQAYSALEIRLRQHEVAEETLCSTISDCEMREKTTNELVVALQFDKDQMVKRISELEATVEEMEVQKQTLECSQANEDGIKFSNMKRDVTPAFQGAKLTNADMDDAELVYWAAVEDLKISQGVVKETDLTSALWSSIEKYMGLTSNKRKPLSLTISIHQPPPLPVSPPPASPDQNDGKDVDAIWGRHQGDSQEETGTQRRSHSADLFSSRLLAASAEDLRWKRGSSVNRDVELQPKESEETDAESTSKQIRHRVPRSSSMKTSGGESILERISRSREFWSARSLSAPQPPSPTPQGPSNGRPSLIPRIAPPLRTPPMQRSVSEYSSVKAGPVAMPVIRSTPSPHLSPRSNETEQDKKNGRSYIPRPINEFRIASDSDGEASDSVKVTSAGRPGQRKPTKVYTTVLAPNRYATPKFSQLSGSSLSPRTVSAIVPDSKKSLGSPSSSFSTGTYQTWRPVVSSTAIGPEEPQLPGSRA